MMNKKMILLIVFITMSAVCMELERSALYSKVLLSQDIAPCAVMPWFSLQSLGRFKQTSRLSNQLYNILNVCSFCNESVDLTPFCNVLANDYYACTKALAYCAREKNVKMFQHWWSYHEMVRDQNLFILLERKELTLEDRMEAYCQHYSTAKETQKIILNDVRHGLDREDSVVVKTVLLGNSVNVFDLIKKECGVFGDPRFEIDLTIYNGCQLDDARVLESLCGGLISSKLFKVIVPHISSYVLAELINTGALPIDTVDSTKKTLLHYAAQYNFHKIIELLLAKGLLVNCVDTKKKTPLHYAAEYRRVYAVMALLDGNADMSLRDRFGRTPLDCLKCACFVPSNDSENKRIIKNLLKAHRNKPHTSCGKRDKMSKKGYSKIE
jgi:hypothetical protein